MKIVLNGCYGNFGLSYNAQAAYIMAYGGIPYFYQDISTYTPDNKKDICYKRLNIREVNEMVGKAPFLLCTSEYQAPIIYHKPEAVIDFYYIDRTDPILISMVEVMGSEFVSGPFAALYVAEVPDGTLYRIDHHDGMETIVTQYDEKLIVAKSNNLLTEARAKIEDLWQRIKPKT